VHTLLPRPVSHHRPSRRANCSPGLILAALGGHCMIGATATDQSDGRPRGCASGLVDGLHGLAARCGNWPIRALKRWAQTWARIAAAEIVIWVQWRVVDVSRNAAAADLPRGRAFSRRRGGWRPPVPALFSLDHLVGAGEQRRRYVDAFAEWQLWNVGATMTAYSALMLAARITLAHFSVSSATSFPNSAGVIGMGSPPSSARRACNFGSANTAFTA
jgi:hypothetical protein